MSKSNSNLLDTIPNLFGNLEAEVQELKLENHRLENENERLTTEKTRVLEDYQSMQYQLDAKNSEIERLTAPSKKEKSPYRRAQCAAYAAANELFTKEEAAIFWEHQKAIRNTTTRKSFTERDWVLIGAQLRAALESLILRSELLNPSY